MIYSKHTLSYCSLCECDMVVCAHCGNNCCNAGTGDINGERCGCDEAYLHQDIFWKKAREIKFSKDIRKEAKLSGDKKLAEMRRVGLLTRS